MSGQGLESRNDAQEGRDGHGVERTGRGLSNLWRLADAETRSISPENPTGERGRGGRPPGSGQGWKVNPFVRIPPGTEHVLADVTGPGTIQHIWLTPTGGWRNQVLRMWWDDDPQPAVECPLGDFFACGWGEVKFYLDDDGEFPTICGTGTEDYFCGSYNFDVDGQYVAFTTPYAGMPQVLRPDGTYRSQQRFGLYRWHLTDPIRFRTGLRVTMQALGWRSGGRYLQLRDDIATVAYWYQTLPLAPFPELPDQSAREII